MRIAKHADAIMRLDSVSINPREIDRQDARSRGLTLWPPVKKAGELSSGSSASDGLKSGHCLPPDNPAPYAEKRRRVSRPEGRKWGRRA